MRAVAMARAARAVVGRGAVVEDARKIGCGEASRRTAEAWRVDATGETYPQLSCRLAEANALESGRERGCGDAAVGELRHTLFARVAAQAAEAAWVTAQAEAIG